MRGLNEVLGELPVAALAEEMDVPGEGQIRHQKRGWKSDGWRIWEEGLAVPRKEVWSVFDYGSECEATFQLCLLFTTIYENFMVD